MAYRGLSIGIVSSMGFEVAFLCTMVSLHWVVLAMELLWKRQLFLLKPQEVPLHVRASPPAQWVTLVFSLGMLWAGCDLIGRCVQVNPLLALAAIPPLLVLPVALLVRTCVLLTRTKDALAEWNAANPQSLNELATKFFGDESDA